MRHQFSYEFDSDMFKNFKLCFVYGNVAVFTTQALNEQWGDDWGDAPYEHNAGHPYSPPVSTENYNPDGSPKWQLLELWFTGEYMSPSSAFQNSPWSVKEINDGAVPWLTFMKFDYDACDYVPVNSINAGATVEEFIDFIQGNNDQVMIPMYGVKPYPSFRAV